MTSARLATGGRIDRSRVIHFTFNGRRYPGHPGDTLASALMANGVLLMARSFKYHRPRGMAANGVDEPNALVQVGTGAETEPNVRATSLALHDGLVANSQNCWPSVRLDAASVLGLASSMIPAGFYYKTFMWPRSAWHFYESVIRRAAGLGRAARQPDTGAYEHAHATADLLVAGAGVAGIAAARAAASAGLRVILADDGLSPGGQALNEPGSVDGLPVDVWVREQVEAIAQMPGVRVLRQTTVYARYDHGSFALLENLEQGVTPTPAAPRSRRWLVQARDAVLATGASERLLVFGNNDRPGVMLASAAQTLLQQFGVLPGRRVVLFTNNDSAYQVARDLAGAGASIVAVVDSRSGLPSHLGDGLQAGTWLQGHGVVEATGRLAVTGCHVGPLADGESITTATRRLECDLLLLSGGWNPRVQLASHTGGRRVFDGSIGAFRPASDAAASGLRPAGACDGQFDLPACLSAGHAAGVAAAAAAGKAVQLAPPVGSGAADAPRAPGAVLHVPRKSGSRAMRFVDLQTDVTLGDLELACREGFHSVEHVKRYTTLGMGTDQGRTGGIVGAAQVARLTGKTLAQGGTTTFRPPYVPVTLGALAAGHAGRLAAPERVTPLHEWHVAAGAMFMLAGPWKRAQLYRRVGETDQQAVNREALNVRQAVGLTDVSTLGKFELTGRDVATLLDRVYVNGWQTLERGKCRYGVMLRIDGAVLDDGTTSRLDTDRYFMTTTTGNAERIHAQLLRCLQIDWPELDVRITPVTEQWAAFAVAGPRARQLLERLKPDFDTGDAAFPYMSLRQGTLLGHVARVMRISFAGELGYEIYVPSRFASFMWEAALHAGEDLGAMPYGTEAMMTLRIEKGFFVPGFEADGRTTADDLGLGRMLSTKKEFIGKAALQRAALADPDRLQLVGVVATHPGQELPRGAQLLDPAQPYSGSVQPSVGHFTSMAFSPLLGRWIALALVKGGRARIGHGLRAVAPVSGQSCEVTLVSPVFVDPEGERVRA
ncbi:sarcosine oxidase subunit alpha family protein [Variovorax sp. VNK109]|uniref:sarcosine oxidase subunit alpha family protein n=1 Tax=Variovorax sp. VNK109 TaxID=3400919 RepID=UPI003C04EC00